MNNLFVCRVKSLLLLTFSLILASSCINEDYALSEENLNLEVTPFGEGVNLPLGKTDKIKLKDLLKDFDSDILDVGEDGSYSINFEGSFEASDELKSLNDLIDIPPVEYVKTLSLPIAAGTVSKAADNFYTRISEEMEVELLPVASRPDGLVSLGFVELEETYLTFIIDASSFPDLGSGSRMDVNLNVDFPEGLNVSGTDDNGVMQISLSTSSTTLEFNPIKIESIDFSKLDQAAGAKAVLKVDGTINFVNASIGGWLGKRLEAKFKAKTGKIDIVKLTGKFDYEIDPVMQSVDLTDLSSGLGDSGVEFDLDFTRAYIALNLNSNLNVSANATVEITPYYNGKANPAKKISSVLPVRKAGSDEAVLTRYWLSDTETGMPAGYTYIKADVTKLLNDIPDKLDVSVFAATDKDEESVLEPKKVYVFNAGYVVCVPLELGDSFKATYKGEINDLPEYLGDLLANGNTFGLAGKIINTLPLALDVQFNLLDSDKKVLSPKENSVLNVLPCNADESASTTDINVVLGLLEGVDASTVKSLEFVVNAKAGGVIGGTIKEDAYLQAILQVALPSGVTLNLKDVFNDDEEK